MFRTMVFAAVTSAKPARSSTRAAAAALACVLTLLAEGNSSAQVLGKSDAPQKQSVVAFTNTDPEFTLTLPDGYKQIKSTADALCTFETAGRSSGAIIAIYPNAHPIDPGPTDISRFKYPDVRRIPATWNSFPVDVIAWHTTGKTGTVSAARSVDVPLLHRAVSILLLIPVEKEALADGLMQDFLTGLDGPSNWNVERPPSATERMAHLALGLGLMLVLLAGPPLGLRSWRRRVVRQKESHPATSSGLQNLAAALATPAPRQPGYWIRVFAVVFVLIAVVLAYLSLVAVDISLIFDHGFVKSFKAVLVVVEAVCALVLFGSLGISIYGLRHRGRVLLDLGPDRMRTFLGAGAMLCLMSGIVGGFAAFENRSALNWANVLLPMMQLPLGFHFLVRTFGRIQMTERGIWQNLTLLRWEQIGSCRWVDDSTLLAVKGEGPLSIQLPVPPDRKQSLDQLLAERRLVPTTLEL